METILNQNNELLKFRYYFGQNRIGKKDGGYKFKEHKKKEMTANEMVTNKLQS